MNYRDYHSSFRSRTCHIYNRHSKQPTNDSTQRCPCGRLVSRHSLDGACLESQTLDKNETWIAPEEFDGNNTHSCSVAVNIFGVLKPNNCKFLRVDSSSNVNSLTEVYKLILEDCNGKKPSLVFNVSGGAKYFTLTDQLQTEVVRDIINMATRADAWILTDGVNNGMSKFIGEGISYYHLLHERANKIKCIGLMMWGTISETERLKLKKATQGYPKELLHRQMPREEEEENQSTLERNHSHCILFDDGQVNERPNNSHREKFILAACHDGGPTCYTVTLMFGGDLNDLELLQNNIKNKHPIVLVQGSGRLTDMLASLFDLTSNHAWNEYWTPTDREMRTAFDAYFPRYTDIESNTSLKKIKRILDKRNRYLLSVFSSDRSNNVVKTIFHAILSAKMIGKKSDNNIDPSNDSIEAVRRLHENRLIDLAFDWDYIDGVTPILQRWLDEMMTKKSHMLEKHADRENELFWKCLKNNRPTFIDFFLSAGFDPRELTKTKQVSECEQIIWDLYKQSRYLMNESHRNRIDALFGTKLPRSKEQLQRKLRSFVGPFVGLLDILASESFKQHISIDFCKCTHSSNDQLDLSIASLIEQNISIQTDSQQEYSKDQLLRDLFLWAVFMNMPEMAKVLLIHVQSRLCAALIASAIFKQYAKLADTVDFEAVLCSQALYFETFAANSIDHCYQYNERTACELLFRQVPIFGGVSCMQVAISSKSEKVLQTACFDQALNLVWCGRLALSNTHFHSVPFLLLSAAFFGLPAPLIVKYKKEEKQSSIREKHSSELSSEGIDYYVNENSSPIGWFSKYWLRFRYFHESPVVKMCYHFVAYTWFLLVFSYMMLYQFENKKISQTHWTEIYVILTVSTKLCEEIRKTLHAYRTQMLELLPVPCSFGKIWLAKAFTILPYLLFYLGMALRFSAGDNNDIFTTARIILAYDLEIWYIQSLKFVIAFKFLGPKLIMLKYMLRDLFAFLYLIFVGIVAYGVVSRSLLFYKQVQFTARDIIKNIFFDSYWFIYTDVTDKDELDVRFRNDTDKIVTEAMATEILLTFHMLFINILLLNLLVAVFTDSIGKVQQNTEFYWRYQRYSFVREYFQRPILAYPPLTIVSHLFLLMCALRNNLCSKLARNQCEDGDNVSFWKQWTPIFKIISKKNSVLDQHWDLFENAATHGHARAILEQNEKKNSLTNDKSTGRKATVSNSNLQISKNANENIVSTDDEPQSITSVKEELSKLKSAFAGIQQDLHKIIVSQQMVTNAISNLKLNERKESSPMLELSSSDINAEPTPPIF